MTHKEKVARYKTHLDTAINKYAFVCGTLESLIKSINIQNEANDSITHKGIQDQVDMALACLEALND